MFGSENIFFAPLKIMTNQKSPAHFWARFSGHGLLVIKSSAKDAGHAYLRGRKRCGTCLSTWLMDNPEFLTLLFSLHFFWTMLTVYYQDDYRTI